MKIKKTIRTYGTVPPKKWGKGVYKVGGMWQAVKDANGKFRPKIHPQSEAGVLAAHGWTFIHKGQSYFYMQAPNGENVRKPVVEIDIPNYEAIKALALACHEQGTKQKGVLDGWEYEYTPSHVRETTAATYSWDGEWGQRTSTDRQKAEFEIGSYSLAWHVHVIWHDGDDNPPTFFGLD